ncbi:MAG: hypothetical protein IT381_01515 [Deltaproteobacteria bacterium]|nr:hypothetical protein [Deltaproteobacteria bacterium]
MVSKKAAPRAKKKTASKRSAPAKAPKEAIVSSGPRRSVFIDVENTSNEAELTRVLDELKVDPQHGVTQVSAIGNWRAVGQSLGRKLAERGAVLVHSAPAARVRDWSDLWIAVQAGIWLGRARAGDIIEIVSHDRAFDAVGDAAAQLGVTFRRITYRGGSAAAAARADARAEAAEGGDERPARAAGGSRRRRGGRRGRGGGDLRRSGSDVRRVTPVSGAAPPIAAPARLSSVDAVHGASPQDLVDTITRLAAASPSRTTTLDALTLALKAAGFHRPPGSPRLVTRLHQLKAVEVLPNGKVRLRGGGPAAPQGDAVPGEGTSSDAGASGENGASGEGRRRRRRRRGRGGSRAGAPGSESVTESDAGESDSGEAAEPSSSDALPE